MYVLNYFFTVFKNDIQIHLSSYSGTSNFLCVMLRLTVKLQRQSFHLEIKEQRYPNGRPFLAS